VIRSRLLDFDLTVKKEGGGLPVRLGLGLQSPARNSGEGAQGVHGGGVLGASGEYGMVYEARLDAGNPMVSSTSSIASPRVCRA
jgi:hypothetical protein